MLVDTVIAIAGLVGMTFAAIGFYRLGARSKQTASHWEGRMDGWRACENLIIERMVKSKNMDLTKREILDEFFM